MRFGLFEDIKKRIIYNSTYMYMHGFMLLVDRMQILPKHYRKKFYQKKKKVLYNESCTDTLV